MLRYLQLLFCCLLVAPALRAQDTLFDQSRVSSVLITIPPDSLGVIMTDVLSDHYFMARFVYDYGTGTDTVENIGFRLRGNTSRYAAKKSFKVSFNEYSPGRRFMGVKKINLNGQHNDPTMVREKLFYDIWNKAGLPERRTSFVRLYINGTYYGLYTNLEEFDKDWLERVYGENDGNLYKCTYPTDLVYLGDNPDLYKNIPSSSVTGGRAYDLQTNEETDDYTDLVGLISGLNQPSDTTFPSMISAKIDVDNVLKAYALDVATGNWDDYFFNRNNYFLYYQKPSGTFSFVTYDTDNTFGVDWFGIDWASRSIQQWYHPSEPRPLITKLLAVPAFNERYKRYLDTIARYFISPDSIFPHIDDMRDLIEQAAIDDTWRSMDYGYDVGDFYNGFTQPIDGHTPYGIKPFLLKRQQTILDQLHPAGVDNKEAVQVVVYPNPASEKIFIESKLPGRFMATLIDMQGRTVAVIPGEGSGFIDVSALPRGMYILHISLNNAVVNLRVCLIAG